MKVLKLDHEFAEAIQQGKQATTWRLFDDKDLSVDDAVLLVDKVDPHKHDTWRPIGVATISAVVQKRLGDLGELDMAGMGSITTPAALLEVCRSQFGPGITVHTPVKLLYFSFSPKVPDFPFEPAPQHSGKVIIYADGGSRGNPGPSASGYVIFDEQKTQLVRHGVYLGVTTNNQAEYTALKLALEAARQLGAREVGVCMDSMLVVNQMKGIFKVKNRDLWPIHDTVKRLCSQFARVTFTQVPRELNKQADAAVNEALDAHLESAGESV